MTDPWFFAVAIPAVILLGLGKGGLVGFGALAVPLMSLVMSPVQAAAITLPILIIQDVVGVFAFRKTFDPGVLALMLPGAVVGIVLGWLFAEKVSTAWIMLVVGLVATSFSLQRLWLERGGRIVAPSRAPPWFGVLCSIAAGFTSQIANAGGPPFQLYILPKKLPRDVMIGTTAIFFAAVNWLKAPAFMALGQFTKENLTATAMLVPLAIASTVAGVWVARRVDGARLYKLVYGLLLVVGVKLVFSGVLAVAG
jgi:uncharacterized membrane protein YfcA